MDDNKEGGKNLVAGGGCTMGDSVDSMIRKILVKKAQA